MQREERAMDHLEFAALESAGLEPTPWEEWAEAAEAAAGHDLDGDQSEDGYSMDAAHAAFKAGMTPRQYAATIPPRR